jgi:pyruvate formate lyase activating enzyme
MLASAAKQLQCSSVAYTYNDPVIFLEYAVDVAQACREQDIKNVAVTAGYICQEPAVEFFSQMDAANVDLKGFTDDFYYKLCGAHLQPVLDTLKYIRHETTAWLEITTLLIPGENDSEQELQAMTQWIATELGNDVPLHFSAFHPDFKMRDKQHTPLATLQKARRIALQNGLRYVYTGNVTDPEGASTWCHSCNGLLIERDRYNIGNWHVTPEGNCRHCNSGVSGLFNAEPGNCGNKRMPVKIMR